MNPAVCSLSLAVSPKEDTGKSFMDILRIIVIRWKFDAWLTLIIKVPAETLAEASLLVFTVPDFFVGRSLKSQPLESGQSYK